MTRALGPFSLFITTAFLVCQVSKYWHAGLEKLRADELEAKVVVQVGPEEEAVPAPENVLKSSS